MYMHCCGLYFVFTTNQNVSPVFAMETLSRVTTLVKDYCGVLGEESIRRNFVLVYELLDEIVDFGFIQTTETDVLKSYIHNPASEVGDLYDIVGKFEDWGDKVMNRKTMSTAATNRPIEVGLKS